VNIAVISEQAFECIMGIVKLSVKAIQGAEPTIEVLV
jgi:hypothetical protein